MYCVRCKHDVIECACLDIDERLENLSRGQGALAFAARFNLIARLLLAKGEGQGPH
jgi:hypothetical protein